MKATPILPHLRIFLKIVVSSKNLFIFSKNPQIRKTFHFGPILQQICYKLVVEILENQNADSDKTTVKET